MTRQQRRGHGLRPEACEGKAATDRATALRRVAWARRYRDERGEEAYHCPHCHAWHVGHHTNGKLENIRSTTPRRTPNWMARFRAGMED